MRVGLGVMHKAPADALTIVRAADRASIHSLWSIDYYNRSSLTRAAAFAAVSETAIVGTSVPPLFARSPLALASAAADVQAMAGGRFVLGVGSSTRRMNQDWYGTALQHPAPQVRERIELIRRLIAHRSGPFRYEGRFDRVSMAHYDRTALPHSLTILAAGVGEHMVGVAGEAMVEERAVFGTPEDVAGQLRRYADVIDGAFFYPPHFGVDPERIHANEMSLIEVASGWTSLRTQPKRVQVVTLDLIDPGEQGAEILGHAEMATGQPVRVAAGQREDQAGRLLRVGATAGRELVAYPAVDTASWPLLAGSPPQRDLGEPDRRSRIGQPDAPPPAEASASPAH